MYTATTTVPKVTLDALREMMNELVDMPGDAAVMMKPAYGQRLDHHRHLARADQG